MNQQEIIQQKTDRELQVLWNQMANVFEEPGVLPMTQPKHPGDSFKTLGILALSRETERRGLVMDKNLYGEIILKPKE